MYYLYFFDRRIYRFVLWTDHLSFREAWNFYSKLSDSRELGGLTSKKYFQYFLTSGFEFEREFSFLINDEYMIIRANRLL